MISSVIFLMGRTPAVVWALLLRLFLKRRAGGVKPEGDFAAITRVSSVDAPSAMRFALIVLHFFDL